MHTVQVLPCFWRGRFRHLEKTNQRLRVAAIDARGNLKGMSIVMGLADGLSVAPSSASRLNS